jgi:hypothetical protein
MVTVYVRFGAEGRASHDEVLRILEKPRYWEKGGAVYANIERREEANLLVMRLRNLHNVQARILEAGDTHNG